MRRDPPRGDPAATSGPVPRRSAQCLDGESPATPSRLRPRPRGGHPARTGPSGEPRDPGPATVVRDAPCPWPRAARGAWDARPRPDRSPAPRRGPAVRRSLGTGQPARRWVPRRERRWERSERSRSCVGKAWDQGDAAASCCRGRGARCGEEVPRDALDWPVQLPCHQLRMPVRGWVRRRVTDFAREGTRNGSVPSGCVPLGPDPPVEPVRGTSDPLHEHGPRIAPGTGTSGRQPSTHGGPRAAGYS